MCQVYGLNGFVSILFLSKLPKVLPISLQHSSTFVSIMKEVEYLREMNDKDLCILKNSMREVSDNVLFIALRYLPSLKFKSHLLKVKI